MPDRSMLVTSLAPHNIRNQQLAVESWMRLGFSVASLNSAAEIDQIKPEFAGVEFVVVDRDAQQDCGKPLVYLDDVIAFLKTNGSPVCGLINSDIHLRATHELIRYLIGEARGSMVLFNRTDVDTLDQDVGEIYKFGFDAFLFDKSVLDILTPTEFCLGQPWWDYWLASRFVKSPQGAPVRYPLKLAATPLAVHVRHEKKWDHSGNYEKYGLTFAKYLDVATHNNLKALPSDKLRNALYSVSVNVAATVLLQAHWLSYIPEPGMRDV